MQPTTNQTVSTTSSVPAPLADRQPAALPSAPIPLDAATLGQISGGAGGDAPNGSW